MAPIGHVLLVVPDSSPASYRSPMTVIRSPSRGGPSTTANEQMKPRQQAVLMIAGLMRWAAGSNSGLPPYTRERVHVAAVDFTSIGHLGRHVGIVHTSTHDRIPRGAVDADVAATPTS